MKTERPLNEKDLKILERREKEIIKTTKKDTRTTLIMSGVCVAGGVIITLINNDALIPCIFMVPFLIGIIVWVFLEGYLKLYKELKGIHHLKNLNKVTSIRVRSQEYYQLIEEEDEGPHYIFQVEPNKILCLGGQEFYSIKKFPNTDFEIAEGKDEKGTVIFFEIYPFGEKLKPLKKIKGKQKADLMKKRDFEGYKITTGKLTELIK